MGLWVSEPRLLAGETVAWRKAANHTRGSLAVGGRLFVTSRRIIFCPHRFEALLGREQWSALLADVEKVGQHEREAGGLFSGGLRRRLEVTCRGGVTELFVVNGLDAVVERIRQAVSSVQGDR